MHRIILALGLFFLVAPAMADEGDFNFKNPEATRALEDYRKKLSEEQQIQRRAIEILKNETKAFEAQWRKELIAKLEAIRTKLLKDANSSEANKINDAIKALKQGSPAGASAANRTTKVTYWPNGQKRSEQHFKNGTMDGPTARWHANGQKKSEGHYKNGKLDGLRFRFVT